MHIQRIGVGALVITSAVLPAMIVSNTLNALLEDSGNPKSTRARIASFASTVLGLYTGLSVGAFVAKKCDLITTVPGILNSVSCVWNYFQKSQISS